MARGRIGDVHARRMSLGGGGRDLGAQGMTTWLMSIALGPPDAGPTRVLLSPGGWRDYVTLLHPPYTLWHLSYVAIGAGLAAQLDGARLVETLLAFFLAMGVGAHALDELNGRPLQTGLPDTTLIALAAVSIGAAAAIGVALAIGFSLWLLAFVAFGSFIVWRTTSSSSAGGSTPTSGSRSPGEPFHS